jgi:hypothetical protein
MDNAFSKHDLPQDIISQFQEAVAKAMKSPSLPVSLYLTRDGRIELLGIADRDRGSIRDGFVANEAYAQFGRPVWLIGFLDKDYKQPSISDLKKAWSNRSFWRFWELRGY